MLWLFSMLKTALDWKSRRQRMIHLTIRDIDCAGFDVDAMIAEFRNLNVTLFSFFAGGYVTTYPSKLSWQRVSPFLGDRDLCGEILEKSRAVGIRAFPMVDLGEVPLEVAEAHPDWVARKQDGSFFSKSDGIVTACALSHYVRECSRELVGELTSRYRIEGMKFGGASYGFPPGVCHCEKCAAAYREEMRRELPPTVHDPDYVEWRERKMRETVRYLVKVVHEVAHVPVVGNSVWHLGRGMDIEDLARDQDFIQVEVQTRTFITNGTDDPPYWERITFPTETTRYVSGFTKCPPWVVASYFLAWPWRRVAVPAAEQKVYLAQIAANGGSPMVNLSGGPPAVHEDLRGFQAVKELYGFMAAHEDLYENDRSGATVAIVFSQQTARKAQREGNIERFYLADLHGCQEILDREHIPYDIISATQLETLPASRYAALVIPSALHLEPEAVGALERLSREGVALVATGAPGIGTAEERVLKLFGVVSASKARDGLLSSPHLGASQGYARRENGGEHPLFEGIECKLLPVSGEWYRVGLAPSVQTPLVRAAAFRLFPEGLSFPDYPDPEDPLAVSRTPSAGGRTLLFPFALGKAARRAGHPDLGRLLANGIRWAAADNVPIHIAGRRGLLVSMRLQEDRMLIHLINLTNPGRFFDEATPLYDIPVSFQGEPPGRVWQASTGAMLEVEICCEGWFRVIVPSLVDYDIVVIDRANAEDPGHR